MRTNGFIRKIKPLELLTEAQCEEIHQGTMEVLEKTGVVFKHKKALEILSKDGCKVDHPSERVRFPRELVEECLRINPSRFTLERRGEGNDVTIGGDNLIMATACGMETIDLDTWEPRPATRQEVYDAVKIVDALENCHMCGAYAPYWGFQGVPSVMAIPEACAARTRNTVKMGWVGCWQESEKFNIAMAKAAGTEIMGQADATSPLSWNSEPLETLFTFLDAELPICVGSGATIGASAPVTIAGSTVLANAEMAAIITLAQLYKPGARTYVGIFHWPMNMSTGAALFGDIGASLHTSLFEQTWRRYGIPTWHGAPGATDGKAMDFQCGYEKSIPALISSLCGGNVLWFLGGIHGELTYHSVQAILDNEVAGMIGHFVEGVEVNEETKAVQLIDEIGPAPGTFLDKDHTLKWWRKEQYISKVSDRLTYTEWRSKGKKDALDYAKERMEEILASHRPEPLSNQAEEEITGILWEARKYYKKIGKIAEDEWSNYMKMLKENDTI